MGDSGIIEDSVREVIFSESKSGDGNFLWDCVRRVARNADMISKLLERDSGEAKIKRVVLKAGACFSYLAELKRRLASGRFRNSNQGERVSQYCSEIVSGELSKVMTSGQVADVNSVIAESYNRHAKRLEAKIISDARNLDDVGIVGLFWDIRRCVLSGRSVSDVIAGWRRKVEYGYWQARLNEDFRLEQGRRIAEQRLAQAESFMDCLEDEHNGRIFDRLADSLAEAG